MPIEDVEAVNHHLVSIEKVHSSHAGAATRLRE
jgi:hypothetical protein